VADVTFLPPAEDEYRSALRWYEARSPVAAARFESEVARSVARLAANPQLYALEDDRHRLCPLGRFPYCLAYRVTPAGDVLVVALAHTARRPGYWRGRS
jgi:plasmid stabilization system protein ParE